MSDLAMLLSYIFKHIKRGFAANCLFCLLIAAIGSLTMFSSGIWYSAQKGLQDMDLYFTTIAIPQYPAIREYGRLTRPGGSQGIIDLITNHINENVFESGLLMTDTRRVYGGYVTGLDSVPIRMHAESGYADIMARNAPQSIAAFVVSCESVDFILAPGRMRDGVRTTFAGDPFLMQTSKIGFNVEEYIAFHGAHNKVREISAYSYYNNPDGTNSFEVGKRYVLVAYNYLLGNFNINILGDSGDILASYINERGELDNDVLRNFESYPYYLKNDEFPIPIIYQVPVEPEDGPGYDLGYEGYTWFEIDGTLDEALASQNGEFIKQALCIAEVSHNSIMLITTNDMNSIMRFNQHQSGFVDGRPFTYRETFDGSKVIAISEQLAEINALSVGDMLDIQIYPVALIQLENGFTTSPFHPSLNITQPMEYEIIGIFSTLAWEISDHAINPNMAIIPDKSITGFNETPTMDLSGDFTPPLLKTIIIPNDELDEARELITQLAAPYGMFFRYFDQGYTAVKATMTNLRLGMAWVFALSGICWGIVGFMFPILYIERKKREVLMLFALGVDTKPRFYWVFTQFAVILFFAHIMALGATLLAYGGVMDIVAEAAITFTEPDRYLIFGDIVEVAGIRNPMPLDKTFAAPFAAAFISFASMTLFAGFLSMKAAKQGWVQFGK